MNSLDLNLEALDKATEVLRIHTGQEGMRGIASYVVSEYLASMAEQKEREHVAMHGERQNHAN